MKKKKASRAKKAAAAATRNTAPAPPQEVEPELRMPTMPAWLSAFVQWFQPVPVVDTTTTTGGLARGVPEISQSEMYRASLESPAARAWKAKPARRYLPAGPSISKLLANDAEVLDPYEQKAVHLDYLTIRPPRKSEWDFCAVCYFEESKNIRAKKEEVSMRSPKISERRKRNWASTLRTSTVMVEHGRDAACVRPCFTLNTLSRTSNIATRALQSNNLGI